MNVDGGRSENRSTKREGISISQVMTTDEIFDKIANKLALISQLLYTNKYILLDILLCSIAEYFYELCRRASQNTNE